MRNANRLGFLFPEWSSEIENWIKTVNNPDQQIRDLNDPRLSISWVNVDINDVWPDLDNRCDVYDARTGTWQYAVDFHHQGQATGHRCMWMKGDWAMIHRAPFVTGMMPFGYRLSTLGMLHVPTGRLVPVEKLPEVDLARGGVRLELEPAAPEGTLLQRAISPIPFGRQRPYSQTLERFRNDGTLERLGQFPDSYLAWLVPHSNQMVVGQSLMDQLPIWIRNYVPAWPWLIEKLTVVHLTVVDVVSRKTLWNVPKFKVVHSNGTYQIDVSQDGKLLSVPEELEEKRVTYAIYSMPISPWLRYWPWLASVVVFLVILSQGKWRK